MCNTVKTLYKLTPTFVVSAASVGRSDVNNLHSDLRSYIFDDTLPPSSYAERSNVRHKRMLQSGGTEVDTTANAHLVELPATGIVSPEPFRLPNSLSPTESEPQSADRGPPSKWSASSKDLARKWVVRDFYRATNPTASDAEVMTFMSHKADNFMKQRYWTSDGLATMSTAGELALRAQMSHLSAVVPSATLRVEKINEAMRMKAVQNKYPQGWEHLFGSESTRAALNNPGLWTGPDAWSLSQAGEEYFTNEADKDTGAERSSNSPIPKTTEQLQVEAIQGQLYDDENVPDEELDGANFIRHYLHQEPGSFEEEEWWNNGKLTDEGKYQMTAVISEWLTKIHFAV